jgi:hypothetical protein
MHRKKNIVTLNPLGAWLFVILFFTTGFSAFSQKTVVDSVKTKKAEVVHSPRKATIYSAVLPGLGQIYNRKYWKLPIVYGGFATLGYFINFNNEQYVKYKKAYSDIIDTDPSTNSFKDLGIDPSKYESIKLTQITGRLRTFKDGWRRDRDLVVIFTAAFYALNIIDASVDAHFFDFDISDDLTINWIPSPMICMDEKLIGLQCKITF